MKVRQGKTFIEFEDDYGWTTRINIRKSDFNLEFSQNSKNFKEKRYININPEESKLFIKKIKAIEETSKAKDEE